MKRARVRRLRERLHGGGAHARARERRLRALFLLRVRAVFLFRLSPLLLRAFRIPDREFRDLDVPRLHRGERLRRERRPVAVG